jgi:hypothetical protein
VTLRALILLALVAIGVMAGEAAPPLPPNAALKYWQASALLPKDAAEKADRVWAQPQGPEAAAFAQECSNSLRLLHDGAAIRRVDWGLNADEGPALLLPHLSKMRQLARVACAAARVDFERKRHAEGFERLCDVVALSRHTGGDGLLIGKLVEIAIARMAADLLASCLPALPPELLRSLDQRLAALPPFATLADAVRMEQRTFGAGYRRKISAAPAAERRKIVNALLPLDAGEAEAIQLLQGIVTDDAKLAAAFADLDQQYAALAAAAALPLPQQQPALAKLEAQVKEANPLVRMVLPAVMGSQQTVAAHDTRMLMLSAAADVVAKGPEALARHKDPGGDSAFTFRKLEVGFELASKLTGRDGKPVTLTVGAPLPAPKPQEDAVRPPGPPPEKPGDF